MAWICGQDSRNKICMTVCRIFFIPCFLPHRPCDALDLKSHLTTSLEPRCMKLGDDCTGPRRRCAFLSPCGLCLWLTREHIFLGPCLLCAMAWKRVSMAAGLRAEGSRMKAGHFGADRALTVWVRRWGRADWVFGGALLPWPCSCSFSPPQ